MGNDILLLESLESFYRDDENNKEKWTGDYIFENEWQSFKTKEKKELEFETPPRPIKEGKKIAVKVIDIFGNDTMKILKI